MAELQTTSNMHTFLCICMAEVKIWETDYVPWMMAQLGLTLTDYEEHGQIRGHVAPYVTP